MAPAWNWAHALGHAQGVPTEENAHPLHRDCTGKIVVLLATGSSRTISSLKKKLIEEGHTFTTETDTEIIAHLVEKYSTASSGNGQP